MLLPREMALRLDLFLTDLPDLGYNTRGDLVDQSKAAATNDFSPPPINLTNFPD
ncbi:MAG: hypothetical protein BroJett011_19410 [Chloroflexota bacterium]|nr:MAG: hypothetical protein BroJett011_19410 [Chloroflexota bacterium]